MSEFLSHVLKLNGDLKKYANAERKIFWSQISMPCNVSFWIFLSVFSQLPRVYIKNDMVLYRYTNVCAHRDFII
jgi:hypothetical protein